MKDNIHLIPANYTDSGKFFGGMFGKRNVFEALILILLIGYPEFALIQLELTFKAAIMIVTLLPIGFVALIGINGDTLFQFCSHIIRYCTRRRKLHLRRVGYKYDERQLYTKKKQRARQKETKQKPDKNSTTKQKTQQRTSEKTKKEAQKTKQSRKNS